MFESELVAWIFVGIVVITLVGLLALQRAINKKEAEIKEIENRVKENRKQCEGWYQQTFDDLIADNKDQKI